MRKGVYIVDHKLSNTDGGVDRKVSSQIKAFRDSGLDVSLCEFDYIQDSTIQKKLLHRLPFTNVLPKWEYREEFGNVNFIYIRKTFCGGSFIKMLKKIREKNPKVKIVMEIPTYPYDAELKSRLCDYPLYLKDYLARNKYAGLIDYIAHLGNDEEIFGVSTLKIYNGFDFETYPVRRVRKPDGVINLVCVAYFNYFSGYDRLLEGLHTYLNNGGRRNIFIHLIGDGPAAVEYRKLADKYGLLRYIKFYGKKSKNEVLDILNYSDIGIGALGWYRKNVYSVSGELKSREYLAAGLPYVTIDKADVIKDEELGKYALGAFNDDSPIDIQTVVDFYDRIYSIPNKNGQDIANEIHFVAEKKYNMKVAMRNVIEYFRE